MQIECIELSKKFFFNDKKSINSIEKSVANLHFTQDRQIRQKTGKT